MFRPSKHEVRRLKAALLAEYVLEDGKQAGRKRAYGMEHQIRLPQIIDHTPHQCLGSVDDSSVFTLLSGSQTFA